MTDTSRLRDALISGYLRSGGQQDAALVEIEPRPLPDSWINTANVEHLARWFAPNMTSLLLGEERPPLPNFPETPGKVQSTNDPRITGAMEEAAEVAMAISPIGRARLPMDFAARMARARGLGFNTEMRLYHGTDKAFNAFDPGKAGRMTGAPTAHMGVWTARDPEIAAEFATMAQSRTGGWPQIYPLLHRAQKPAQTRLTGDEKILDVAATLDDLWSKGYDSLLLKNYTSPSGRVGDIVVVREPSQLRSPQARFDPAQVHSRNLLAGGAGLGLFGPLAFPLAGTKPSQQATQ